jgi:tRNA dimethylallyltransferase
LIAVLGPTAAGKSALAMELARRTGAEIISVDSMQVYRGMDIGTAKPTPLERRAVSHHMIDIADPEQEFTVAEFRRKGREVIAGSDSPLIICGGSGLHFRSIVDPMSFAPTDPDVRAELEGMSLDELVRELLRDDPEAATHVDLANQRRVMRAVEIRRLGGGTPSERFDTSEAEKLRRYESEVSFVAVGVDPGDALPGRISARLDEMREGGLVDEVKRLAPRLGRTARAAVGYSEILGALERGAGMDQAFSSIARNTTRLARRQRTWFQRDPRIVWIPWTSEAEQLADRAEEVMK